jgi:hypothetical protein
MPLSNTSTLSSLSVKLHVLLQQCTKKHIPAAATTAAAAAAACATTFVTLIEFAM